MSADFLGNAEAAARLRLARQQEQALPQVVAEAGEQHRGQLRMAERMRNRHRDDLRHVHGVGWHLWDGARWARDLNGAAMRAAVQTVKAAYADLADLGRDDQRDLLSDIHKCESAAGLDGMLKLAGNLLPLSVSVDQLDADPYLFNTANGTLDLRSGKVRLHDPADLLTKVAGCGYDPAATSDTFDRFLAEVQPDPEMRAFIARLFGHAMVGKVIEHLLPICTGTGANRKRSATARRRRWPTGSPRASAAPDDHRTHGVNVTSSGSTSDRPGEDRRTESSTFCCRDRPCVVRPGPAAWRRTPAGVGWADPPLARVV